MADKITISKQAAYAMRYLVEDIMNVADRAGCSDKYFRNHFMNVIQAGINTGAYKELYDALGGEEPAAETKQTRQSRDKWN